MSKIPLAELRGLRRQADEMLKHAGNDLKKFLRDDDKRTFLRTPRSLKIPEDVNVTTTCSCLMSLALTDQLGIVYEDEKLGASEAFQALMNAPWMSSGLPENNAFTTTLVIRTLGFLLEANVIDWAVAEKAAKEWDLQFGMRDNEFNGLTETLKVHDADASAVIWRSLSDKAQHLIKNNVDSKRLLRLLCLELARITESSWIFSTHRFPNTSEATRKKLDEVKTAYDRAAANRRVLTDAFPKFFQITSRSLVEIASLISADPANFRVNEYPPAAAIIYWFVDGIARSEIYLDGSNWSEICNWATSQFNHQRSLVVAEHAALMDPVAMAMAACLCARLGRDAADLGAEKEDLEILPSQVELEHSILELFEKQTNGIWPKYFPLFHYQEAGSNFCFTFELLEAFLVEFGKSELLDNALIVKGLADAVEWCKQNRLPPQTEDADYIGWNSGGSIETLEKHEPESWATAVVHMFLWELSEVLSAKIQQRLLTDYQARAGKTLRSLDEMVDIDVPFQESPTSIFKIFKTVVSGIPKGESAASKLRAHPLDSPHSALLFGPPGTSKTDLAKAVAHELDWPLIQIDPSRFLRANLDHIYVEAEKIFEDLMDLSGVVVLFDEMDALVQTRDFAGKLDTAAQFLTTFMLPKLTKLHDEGRTVFFMATNFQDRFDEAIKRRGRFDVLLCVGPPTLAAKIEGFHIFLGEEETDKSKEAAALLLKLAKKNLSAKDQLELYTFGEFKGLVKGLGKDSGTVLEALTQMSAEDFSEMIAKDSQTATLRLQDLQGRPESSTGEASLEELKGELQLNRQQLEKKGPLSQITRYRLDWPESRIPKDLIQESI